MEISRRIRTVYLYAVSGISVVVMIVASIGLINLVLGEYVFDVKGWSEMEKMWECTDDTLFYTYDASGTKILKEKLSPQEMQDKRVECEKDTAEFRKATHDNDMKRDLVNYISMLLVAIPLYVFHWRIIKKENK